MYSGTISVLRHKKTHNLAISYDFGRNGDKEIVHNNDEHYGNFRQCPNNDCKPGLQGILKQMMIVDEHTCELSTRSEISTSLIFDLFKLQLVGKFYIDWKIVHFFNEDGFGCIGRGVCGCV